MLDGLTRRLAGPRLARAGERLARFGVPAAALTAAALGCGLAAAAAVAARADIPGLVLFLVGRLLDGAAQAGRAGSERGAVLAAVADAAALCALPLAFALRDQAAFALPAAALLFALAVDGAGTLSFRAAARRRGLEPRLGALPLPDGVAVRTETTLALAAAMLFPAAFPALAYGLGGLTLMAAVARLTLAWRALAEEGVDEP